MRCRALWMAERRGVEVGDAVLVLDNDLAIDEGRFAGELGGSFDHPAIWSGSVPAMAGESPSLALPGTRRCLGRGATN